MSNELACDRWGVIGGPDSDERSCYCQMCRARRWDRLTKSEKRTREHLRPGT